MNANVPRRRSDEPVRVGVVGVGGMGVNHARVYHSLKGAELVAVVDSDERRRREAEERFGCTAFEQPEHLVGLVDAASVAVPSVLHAEVGSILLAAGIHCLVEKPMATSEAEAAALLDAARSGGARLLVGHIERFNPAVRQLGEILEGDHELLALSTQRMSAVSSRITDVDVVTDLMVHDLDIVLDLVGEPVVDVTARGAMRRDVGDDFVTALLTFASGTLATLTASRVTQNRVRQLEVTTDSRFFTVDYSNQELLIYRQGRIGAIDGSIEDGSRYVLDVGTERVFVRRIEPLSAELAHFVDVARGDADPLVTGEQALEALRLVWAIQQQVAGGQNRAHA